MALVMRGLVALVLLVAPVHGAALHTDVTPLQKVIEMLQGMTAKGKAEKQKEEVEFAEKQAWCDSTRDSTKANIDEAADEIQQLEADIAKATSDAEVLAGEIEQLEAVIAKNEAELAKAVAIRKKEKADYSATHLDFSESIDAIERAIEVLKNKEKDVPQSLLQVRSSALLPARAKAAIESFLAMGASNDGEESAPEANAYEFQSGGVVALLEKLRLKFQDERLALEKEELNTKANFDILKQKLTDDIEADKATVSKKTAVKASKLEAAATGKGDLDITTARKAEDEKKLSATLAECDASSQEFENNQVVRAEELKAIATAVKILTSDKVSGNADKHLPAALAQEASTATSLAQFLDRPHELVLQRRVAAFLQGRASRLGSRFLALAASRSVADPFAKVKQMVKDMIVKLMEEANSEADTKAYCDTELATNKQTRDNKAAEVESLASKIDELSAESQQLSEDLTTLSDQVAELRRQQAEATKLRNEESATNKETIADSKEAQIAVERATTVLNDFYGKSADSSLLQDGAGLSQEMAAAASEPYTGMSVGGGNIASFLEVVLSDFARLEAETSAAEDQAASTYKKFMDESTEDIAVKETEIEHKATKKERAETDIASSKKELKLTQVELDAALEYYDKLKPDCVDSGLSYEDRVNARQEEIQSLQEALKILNGEALA